MRDTGACSQVGRKEDVKATQDDFVYASKPADGEGIDGLFCCKSTVC